MSSSPSQSSSSNATKYTLFPIPQRESGLYALYKQSVASFWTPEEIDFSKDMNDWDKLTPNEQRFLKQILAFFAGADGIVQENLATRFQRDVDSPVARLFYAFQNAMEGVHCVAPETRILTDTGYFPIIDLVNQHVNVWNGREFSNVHVLKTSTNTKLLNVVLNNGMNLSCTEEHKWFIRKGNQNHPERCKMEKVLTRDLVVGDVIYPYITPIVEMEDSDIFLNPYTHGFFCGDGTYNNGYPCILLYHEKQELLPYLDVSTICQSPEQNRTRCQLTGKINKDKFVVPIHYSVKTRLEWLSGYVDADGCVNKSQKGFTSIQIGSIELDFLKEIQIMLTTLGVKTNISKNRDAGIYPMPDGHGGQKDYVHKACYVLYITHGGVRQLVSLGFNPHRLKISVSDDVTENPSLIKVEAVIDEGRFDDTYCFNEPILHAGTFNGIVTGQSETYSLLIDKYVQDKAEQDLYFRAIDTIPCIGKKADWALKWISSDKSFATRLVAFACVEGIFFSGAFCAIYWIKKRGLLPGLTFSNELISRDEGLHTLFAVEMYKLESEKISGATIHEIIQDAVRIEKEFICDSLPCSLIGMNATLMTQYIEFVADRLAVQLGAPKLYNVQNPFDFMEMISMEGKGNFFERKISDYSKAGVGAKQEDMVIRTDLEDF
jgi:ribonucleotide reductase beta subunit family protein with ferritin-like domain